MKKKPAIGSWVVDLECVVYKAVVCENCTREQARKDPFLYAVEEIETDQFDWTVLNIADNG